MNAPRIQSPEASASRWWREFEIPANLTFLNHAGFGPITKRARQSIESYMDRWGRFRPGPDVDHESYDLLTRARRDFANMIGVESDRVAVAPNASYGLNTILWGIDWKPGERILVPEVEFPAVVYVVKHLAELRGLQFEALACPKGYFDIADLEHALQRPAAALVFSWVQYFNGYRYNLAEITEVCRRRNCFTLVDGSQGVGAVPLHAADDGIDALACAGQKWLFGQPGSGFFYIGRDTIRPVEPLYAGWMGVDWDYTFSDLQRWDRTRFDDGRRWEVATYPYFALRTVAEGLSLLSTCGAAQVWRNIQHLLSRLITGLDGSRYQPFALPDGHDSGILAIDGPQTAELHRYLIARRFHLSLREGRVRVSPHFYTREMDIDRLLKSIRTFEKTL